MEIFRGLENLPADRPVLCVGVFDGVHLGHRRLIERAAAMAAEMKVPGGVLTFSPHPSSLLGSGRVELLSPDEEKAALIARTPAKRLVLAPFDRQTADLSPRQFVESVLVGRLGISGAVVGYNFTFGKGGKGTPAELQTLGEKYGFAVSVVDPVIGDGEVISSTRIRSLLAEGRIERANRLLGHPYSLYGEVVGGDRRGRTLGFPTANIRVPEGKLLPRPGVYAGLARVDGQARVAVVNIGFRPTFGGGGMTAEAHLLDFKGDLYGRELWVDLGTRIRDERSFSGPRELIAAIEEDCSRAAQVYSRFSLW